MRIIVENGYFDDVEYDETEAEKAISSKIKTINLKTIEGEESDLIEFLNMFNTDTDERCETLEELQKWWGNIIVEE